MIALVAGITALKLRERGLGTAFWIALAITGAAALAMLLPLGPSNGGGCGLP